MTTIERPGIHPKWAKKLKSSLKAREGWYADNFPDARGDVDEYVRTGVPAGRDRNPQWGNDRLYRPCWQDLQMLQNLYLFELESQALAGNPPHFDTAAAMRCFASCRLHWLIEVERGGDLGTSSSIAVALGIVLGCRAQTDAMVRRWLNRNRSDSDLLEVKARLIAADLRFFRYALFGDFLGEAPLYPAGREPRQPILAALLNQWRDPDPAAIAPLCLGVCDLETRQHDDAILYHYALPIDILLLFRLRQWLGLENPVLDHPIMNSPLGQLPEEVPFAYDELQQGFYNRMVEAGFDEASVLANDPDLQGTRP